MSLFTFGSDRQKNRGREAERAAPCRYKKRERIAGNVFFALFAAVAMVGTVGYGFNTVLRGPISTMTEVTRRTVAESTVVTSSRLAIVGATTQQANADCDNDGMVEPLPFRDPAGGPAPVGGGYLPADLAPNSIDPWKTEYGYCAWDSGSITLHTDCGSPPNRLAGAPDNKQYAIAIISAGKDKTFQTSCVAFDPGNPTASLVVTPEGSDDIVLGYTYAEANDLGAGMWRPDPSNPENVAETRSALEATGNATFGDAVVLQGNVLTGGGLLLPGDPGDNSLTGPCNMANDRQIRRNTSTSPPSMEICNFSNGPTWAPLSGTASGGGGAMTGSLVSHWRLDEESGTIARDSAGGNIGFLQNGPAWTEGGVINGALSFTAASNHYVRVPRNASLEPNAVSISMWIRRNGAQPQWAGLLTKTWNNNNSPTHHSYGLYFDDNSDTAIRWQIGYTGGQRRLTYDGIPNNEWTHIVASYDPAAAAPQLKLYINGALVEDGTATDAILYDTTNTGDLFIGSTQAANSERFNGTIDDVRIYSHAIGEDLIAQLYASGQGGGLRNPVAERKGRMLTWGQNTDAEIGAGSGPNATIYHYPTPVVNGEDFIQVGMGCHSACGLKTGGTVWCWGQDDLGQLGNGPSVTGYQTSPTKVVGLSEVVQISAGCTHACALKRDGSAWCWGEGAAGRLGNGTITNAPAPTRVSNINDFTFIAAGREASCGIRQNGQGWCWGGGTAGQLGNGGTTQQTVPVQISNISNWAKINLSRSTTEHACGVTKDGRAYCWGTETSGNFGNGATSSMQTVPSAVLNSAGSDVWTDWVDIETTNTTTCGVRANGTGWCWGVDTDGQIGNGGATTNTRTLPTQVATYTDFSRIAVGTGSVCGVRQNRDVVCWGNESHGELANGSHITGNQDAPYPTPLKNVVDISLLMDNGIALIDSNVRSVIAEPADVGKLATPSYSGCAIDHDGTAWCWGPNHHGELGHGASGARDVPARVADAGPWVQISGSGGSSVCGIKGDATLWCWGSDDVGQLGNGAGVTGTQFGPSLSPDAGPWARVSVGEGTACGIKNDGTAWCWGRLMGTNYASPTQVGTAYRWKYISAGDQRFCGITTDGTAMCQGAGENGVLGNGQTAAGNYALAAVLEKGPWIQIHTGSVATCGVKIDGTAWCWGAADHGYNWGRLGNGFAQGNFSRPQLVADMGPWAYIHTGYVTCGIKVDGSAWCWGGTDGEGKLGHGQLGGFYPYPVRVSGDGRWTAISSNSCGMKEDRTAWCWGGHGVGNPAASAIEPSPYRVANFPHPNPWMGTQDGGGVTLRKGVGVEIGTQRNISAEGAANTGLRLGNDGRATASVAAGTQQFTIESVADMHSAQLSLKTRDSVNIDGVCVQEGLLAYWRFDEMSGSTASDSIGANHGSLVNSPTWVAGRIGGALDFNGTNQSVTITNHSALDNLDSLSVCGWFYNRNNGGNWVGLVSKDTVGDEGWDLYAHGADPTVGFDHRTPFGYAETDGLPKDQWQHLCGTAGGGSLRLYRNGALVRTDSYGGAFADDSAIPVVIGGLSGGVYPLNGMADDVRIYNRALSADEVLSIYNDTGDSCESLVISRAVGADSTTGTLKFSRNTTDETTPWLPELSADLEFTPSGNVGIGTGGSPQAKLDVRGAIKLGEDGGPCNAGKAGALQWAGGALQYCNGSSWQPLGSSGEPIPWTSVSYMCGLRADGTAWCWGDTYKGDGNAPSVSAVPVQVQTDTGPGGWNDWVQLEATNRFACGIRANGTAWCWGSNETGNLGDGSYTARTRPVQVQTDTGPGGWSDWTKITVGAGWMDYGRACGIRTDGSAWCWGNPTGDGTDIWNERLRPVRVVTDAGTGGWNDWIEISSGETQTCGIRTNGSAWCWGYTSMWGAIGDGTTTDRESPTRVTTDTGVGFWSDWREVRPMQLKTCGIRIDGSAWCWGHDGSGQLGCGWTCGDTTRPGRVVDDTGSGFWSDWVSLGGTGGLHQGCGIRADGSAWCWGGNYAGELGNGTTDNTSEPVMVQTDTGPGGWYDWVRLTTAGDRTCGVRANGTAWCWGNGDTGGLGNGSTADQLRPVQVQVSP